MRHRFPKKWPACADKYLYHYTTATTALTKILPTRTLRAGSFVDMNDPREAKTWCFASPEVYSDNPEEQQRCELKNIQIREDALAATQLAQQSTRVVCFSQDDSTRKPSDLEIPVGRGFSLSPMWSHYASNHSGVCLVFDKGRMANAINTWLDDAGSRIKATGWMFEGEVEYRDREDDETFLRGVPHQFEQGFRGLRMETLSHVDKYHQQLFFQKSLDWKYENEYRYIFWGEGTEPIGLPFGDALAGIVIGENFGEHPDLGALAKACFFQALDTHSRELGVQTCMLWWHNGIPLLAPRTRKKW